MLASRFCQADEQVKKLLFVTYFSNVYCCSLWVTQTKKIEKKVRIAYNDCFRALFKIRGRHSISVEFVSRRINTFEGMRRINMYSLPKRISIHNNENVNNIVKEMTGQLNPMFSEWTRLLNV